jgi:hypothetical protein
MQILNTLTVLTERPVRRLRIDNPYVGSVDCQGEVSDLPYIVVAGIAQENIQVNEVDISEGELYIVAENLPSEVDIYVNVDGELVVTADDSERYFIDFDTGFLLYDPCEPIDGCGDYVFCDYVEEQTDYVTP